MQARSSLILFSLFIILCSTYASGKVITGAERMDQYLPLIKGKRVGMVVNHTSIVGTEPIHLLDTLLKQKIDIVKVFAPEHGFRGNADAGETVKDGKDSRTGVTIVSLYGDNKKTDCRPTERYRCNLVRHPGCGRTFLYIYQYDVLCNGSLCGKQKRDDYTGPPQSMRLRRGTCIKSRI